ncbi:hypothetical protein [Virgibacillus siamensis]|uniref:hypothetical protein n=1 Tax=Virgibacillus siamensis TaxID=480071 RepID=UPI00098560B5|nr:hypothetical protein [Virgibacillus siamensis]
MTVTNNKSAKKGTHIRVSNHAYVELKQFAWEKNQPLSEMMDEAAIFYLETQKENIRDLFRQ